DVRYRDRAIAIAAAMDRDFSTGDGALHFDRTADKNAFGVFAKRATPFAQNSTAARFLATLGNATHDAKYVDRAKKILAALATPRRIEERGRMVGDYLLALDEAGAFPW